MDPAFLDPPFTHLNMVSWWNVTRRPGRAGDTRGRSVSPCGPPMSVRYTGSRSVWERGREMTCERGPPQPPGWRGKGTLGNV